MKVITVYASIRHEDKQPVILKISRQDYPSLEELARYRQEYDIISYLSDINGVITAYNIEKYNNKLIIYLEDFNGKSLKTFITKSSNFKLEELLEIAIKISDILGKIHQQNIIHKDINPANLIWNPITKILKIIDFGISTKLSRQYLSLKNPEVLEGTLPYISPEQIGRMNRAVDYRTDFYSLGITFYELFVGQLPFVSEDAMELVHCHIGKKC